MIDHWLTTCRWAPSGSSSLATTAGSTPATAASSSRHPSSSSKAAEASEWQTVKTSGPRPKGRRPGAEQADGPGPGATPAYASASPLDFLEPWRDDAGPSDEHSGPAPVNRRPQQRPVVMPAVSEDELPEDWEEAAAAADSVEKDEAAALAAEPADEIEEAALAADTNNDEALAAVTAAGPSEEAASAVDSAEEGVKNTLTADPAGEVGQAALTAGTSNGEGAAAALATVSAGRHTEEAAPEAAKAAATNGGADYAAHAADAQADIDTTASNPIALLSAAAHQHSPSDEAEAADSEQCGEAAPLSAGAAAATDKVAEHLLDGSGTVEATDAVSESLEDSTRLHSATASGHSGVAFDPAAELPSLSQTPATCISNEHVDVRHDSTLSGHAANVSVSAEACSPKQTAAADSEPGQHVHSVSEDAINCDGNMGQGEQRAVALDQVLHGETAHVASHSDLASSPHQLDEDIVWKQVR